MTSCDYGNVSIPIHIHIYLHMKTHFILIVKNEINFSFLSFIKGLKHALNGSNEMEI